MANEKANIEQNIITPPTGDREKEKRLLEALKAIPDEEIIRLGEERDEEERLKEEAEKREEEEKKKCEIPQDLEDFRKKWEEKINLDEDTKKVIVEAAKSIPLKVETESDGSRLIEFKLGDKTYKILYPKLKAHSDDEYKYNPNYDSIIHIDNAVQFEGMWGDDVEKWKNKKLKEYVKEKQGEGLHIPKIEEMKAVLTEIGESAGLDGESDQIAMLMYLTGMDGYYRLSMGDDKTSGSQISRSFLLCYVYHRYFGYGDDIGSDCASLCLIACEGDDGEVTPKVDSDPEQEMIDFFSSVNGNPKYHY